MVRTIIIPEKDTINISIPKHYVGEEVEVIAFAKNEGLQKNQIIQKKVSFDAISIDTKGFRFNRDEANER